MRAPVVAHQDQAGTDNLAGLVDRITFHDPENGYCVLLMKVRGQRELLTVACEHAANMRHGKRKRYEAGRDQMRCETVN